MPIDFAQIHRDRYRWLRRRWLDVFGISAMSTRVVLGECEGNRYEQQKAADRGESNVKVLHNCDVHVSNK